MSLQNKNPITYALKSIRENTTTAHKKKLAVLMLLILVSAILDVVGLAAVLPLLKAATDTAAIRSNEYLYAIYSFLGCSDNNSFLLYMIGALLAYFVLKTAFGVFVNWFQAKVTSQLAVYVANKQFDKYFSLMYIDFSKIKSSLLIRNMLYNPSSYVQWIIHPILMLFSEFTILLLIVGGIAAYDIFLFTFILITLGPATIIVYRALRKKGARIGTGIDQVFPYTLSSITEAISGYVDIKLAGQEGFYRNKYLRHLKNYMELQQSLYLHSQIPLRLNELIALFGIIVILLYALFIETGSKDVMIMVGVFAAAAYRLMPSINRILSSMMYLNNNKVSIENLYMFDERMPNDKEETSGTEPLGFTDAIRFENVTFTFPDSKSPVISDITLEVKKGERVGFVGVSGSGKTTLMNLMLRLYTEDEGRISVDHKALTKDNMKSWRKLIGYVKQDIFILDGSIRENIILADPHPDEERLKMAIRQASLEKFVNSLPDGMNTMVGERGGNLSGGQKQRIGIARSLYRNAEVLVFDEATSALDNQTENEVTEAIDALSQTHKTIFIIAHRLTTLKSCDKIYELRNGKIAGIHTYKELIEKMM